MWCGIEQAALWRKKDTIVYRKLCRVKASRWWVWTEEISYLNILEPPSQPCLPSESRRSKDPSDFPTCISWTGGCTGSWRSKRKARGTIVGYQEATLSHFDNRPGCQWVTMATSLKPHHVSNILAKMWHSKSPELGTGTYAALKSRSH